MSPGHRRPGGWLRPFVIAVAIVACRPPIGVVEPSAGETIAPTDSPPPAAKLMPDEQTNVQLRLFRGLGPADSALLYGQALDSYRDANLTTDITPPIFGYEPFAVEPSENAVTLWVGTISDVAPSLATGLELVAVGELSGRDPTVIAGFAATLPGQLVGLEGEVVIAETDAAATSLGIALASEGGHPSGVLVQKSEDPAAPFDPSPLLDQTALAAAVSDYDGWARIQESAVLLGESPESLADRPLADATAPLLGELIWVQRRDLDDEALRPAVTALLGVLGQTQIACRDAVEDCAGVFSAQSDRTPEGLAWSIDQVNRTLFPAPDGILHIDAASWDRTIEAMATVGADVGRLTFTNELVDAVVAAIGSDLDLTGADWTPRTDLPLFP